MKIECASFIKFLLIICLIGLTTTVFPQTAADKYAKSQEVSEEDGIPVIIKHLPEWEKVSQTAVLIKNNEELKQALGEQPVFDLVDFTGGTEAVSAVYPEGKLLIIEYNSPQFSLDADSKFNARLAELGQNPPIFYRRIGNYNAFLFDGVDESSANALFDQIKYQKVVQWIGNDPTIFRKTERVVVETFSGMFVGTVIAIIVGFGMAFLIGGLLGVAYFYWREQQRATMDKFSDAGGMTRLNLDELTPEISPERLLK